MAFIYLSGGPVLSVTASREAITNDLEEAGAGQTLVYEVGFRSLDGVQTGEVTVVAANIAAVSDRPLTGSHRR